MPHEYDPFPVSIERCYHKCGRCFKVYAHLLHYTDAWHPPCPIRIWGVCMDCRGEPTDEEIAAVTERNPAFGKAMTEVRNRFRQLYARKNRAKER